MLNQQLLNELKTIIKKDYRKKLDSKELIEVANTLVSFYEILAKIQAREQLKNKNHTTENNPQEN